ncbi:MAG TPA: DUF1592 domain-containing protein [Polyangiaceae bacterium]|nr:DUF1592 domain-containing protein [Polyangiaceae bacterium]
MKPPRNYRQCATSDGRATRIATTASLRAVLLLVLGCSSGAVTEAPESGSLGGGGPQGNSGAGGAAANAGQGAVAQGANGQGASGQGAMPIGGASAAGATNTGSAGQKDDPYAIPSSPPNSVVVPTPRVARLSRLQWSNAVRDLLKLADISEVDSGVTGDALIGFDNEAESLFVTEQLRQQLATAAEKLASKVTSDASALARLLPANAPSSGSARARAFVTTFGQRAFRRPLTDAEVTTHLGLFDQGPTLYPGVDAFAAGASLVIQAMLQSPHFLYRTELGTAAAGAATVALSDWEVASKLAFAITNTMPDDALLSAAAAGQLRDRASISAQAQRLLEGATGTAGLRNFNLQVYRLGTYDGIERDATRFPDFKVNTPAAMKAEVLQFIDWLFTQGRGIKDFYTTPVGFVNSLLAPLYGVSGNFSSEPAALSKVDLDPTKRSGLLTQAGFLSSYISVGDEPDIIHRGVFIATRLLCKTLPPPDPAAAGKGLVDTPNLTNRERVEATTGKGTCGAVCHGALFNPLGYAFENYDAVGKYRTQDQGKPVDAADSYMLDGQLKSFKNGVELSALLAEAKETHSCYLQNMLSYLQGQELSEQQRPLVDYYARLSRAGKVSLRDLELQIVTSEAFLNRRP